MATDNLPVEAYQLGIPLAEYRLDQKGLAINLVLIAMIGVPCLMGGFWDSPAEIELFVLPRVMGAGAVSLIYGVYSFIRTTIQSNEGKLVDENPLKGTMQRPYVFTGLGLMLMVGSIKFQVLMFVMAFVFFGIAGLVALDRVRIGRLAALTFSNGISYIQGNTTEVFRWDEIDMMWTYFDQAANYLMIRRQFDGLKMKIDPRLKKSGELMQTILDEVGNRLLNKARQALQTGATLEFGPISMNKVEIWTAKHSTQWNEIQELGYNDKGIFRIKIKGKYIEWKEVHVNDIPNLTVIMQLTGDILGLTP